jgi:exodeoxyribonuclease V gamma subunit
MVIVPSAAMKSWLMLQMAKDPEVGVCAGLEIGFLETTIKKLFEKLGGKEKLEEYYEPSELELALALEENITKVATDSIFQAEWQPLLLYLGVSRLEKKLSKQSQKRIRALSATLAKLFLEYGVSGGAMVAEWQQNPTGWQALLWQRMESVFSTWQYPAKKFGKFSFEQSIQVPDMQIHVFGISFLTALHHRFLQTIAERIPVFYYILSPCQKFWGDILSEKESLRIRNYWDSQGVNQGHLEVLEDFLRDRNPLLANFGRLGREMAVQMEAIEAQTSEIYSLPESISGISCYEELDAQEVYLEKKTHSLTMLEAIQADLTLLRSTENKTKISFEAHDGTIQVHAVPKKSREVQVLYDALLAIIDKHAKDENPITPSDIFVMAPNISEYIPFIQSVFESTESQLDVQVMDLEIPSQYLIIQGYLHLLSLIKGRWEASSILQLFNYSAFRKRHRLNVEDVALIETWIKDAGIFWGKDDRHRREIFKRNYHDVQTNDETTIGTWEYGLGRLLEGLAMLETADNSTGVHNPLSIIETSQAGILGKVLFLLRSLQEDLKPLITGKKLTLCDWTTYFRCLFDAYFLISDDTEANAQRILITHIESFAKAAKKLPDVKFSFETIHRHLLEGLKKEKSIYKESNVQSVRFSSLLPMRAVPAKVIVLMGMDDGRFPGIDQANSLNLLFQSTKADFYPSRVDFDRYVFLESILSARQYFILSYTSQLPGESKFQQPSLLIKELLNYIDEAFCIKDEKPSEYCLYNHPLIPFHHAYFSETSRLKSHSQKHYEAAQALYHQKKQTRRDFISEFTPGNIEQKEIKNFVIDLKDLLAFAKNPNKVYLNQVLGIFLSQDNAMQDEEQLFLSDLNASILTKQGLHKPIEAMLKQAEKIGKIPYGPFSEVATTKIQKDINRYLRHLQFCDIHVEDLFSIDFREHYQEPQYADKEWTFPPISLEIAPFGNVKIVGKIENVSQKGVVLFHKEEIKKILENWPSCLILKYFIEKYSLSILSQMIFVKGEKVKMRTIEIASAPKTIEESLVDYLFYYLKCKDNPCPLTPDLVPAILEGDVEELVSVFKAEANDSFRFQYDPYAKWLERNSSAAEVASTISHWKSQAERLFIDIFADSKSKKIVRSEK